MNELDMKARSSLSSYAGFWLLFQALFFMLYVAAEPDYMILHNLPEISPRECLALGAALSFVATLIIPAVEKNFRIKLVPQVTLALLGIWAVFFCYVLFFTPVVMMEPAGTP